MSFNSLHYDNCNYSQVLAESEGPGMYMLGTPANTDKHCLPDDPYIRAQTMRTNHGLTSPLIDVDSELMNITRPATQCPTGKYLPHPASNNFCSAPNTHSMTPTDTIAPRTKTQVENFQTTPQVQTNCFKPTESTRLSNPPCTLRGTGWNRWEWLCQNPQDRVEVPFDHMINSTLVARDNHRPLIPTPLDQSIALPVPKDQQMCETLQAAPEVPTGPASVSWRREADYGY